MKAAEVSIQTEFIKLDSLLKYSGLCSTGGEAKAVIEGGAVLLNDEICSMRGKKIRPGDEIAFAGQIVRVVRK